MQWEFMVALILGIPVILFPVAFVWFLNIGGIYAAMQEARKKRAARGQGIRAVVEEHREKKQPVGAGR
jgi:hypothetical protein